MPTRDNVSQSVAVTLCRYSGRTMARPPKGDDATQNLRPEDKTQRAKESTKIGLLPRASIFADFKKIVRGKRD